MDEKEVQTIKEQARRVLAYREEMADKVLDLLEGHTCSEARFILAKAQEKLDKRATVQIEEHIKCLIPYFKGQKKWEPAGTGSEG